MQKRVAHAIDGGVKGGWGAYVAIDSVRARRVIIWSHPRPGTQCPGPAFHGEESRDGSPQTRP